MDDGERSTSDEVRCMQVASDSDFEAASACSQRFDHQELGDLIRNLKVI